jgi:hypothetical protein
MFPAIPLYLVEKMTAQATCEEPHDWHRGLLLEL